MSSDDDDDHHDDLDFGVCVGRTRPPHCNGSSQGRREARSRGVRSFLRLLAILLVVSLASCRTALRRPPAPTVSPSTPPVQTEPDPDVSYEPPSPAVAAIIDSIRAAVRDSIAAASGESIQAAARREEAAAAARRDSIEAAEQASIAEGLRRDSIAAAARRDSIEAAARDLAAAAARRDSAAAAARRDSVAAAARRDSVAAVARRDSITAAFRRDSVAAALQDSLAAVTLRDSIAAAIEEARAAAPVSEDLDVLRNLGPSYIPYDESPLPVWDTETQANVTKALLPVVRAESLEARTRAYFWLLIRADGTVDQTVLQTSSGNASFDATAEVVAKTLLFRPAMRAGRAVPTWVVRNVSLVM